MAKYITIDGGTTNTRVSLVIDYKIVDTLKFNVGARLGIENGQLLKDTIRAAISELLVKHNLTESDIKRVLAAGMITSEYGIYELPHIKTPSGLAQLAKASVEVEIPEITSIKFKFISGIKTSTDSYECADMMRGEEAELMGIIEPIYGECVYILPGSHSKIIKTDNEGIIQTFKTMLTGEMIAALSQNTVLKGSMELVDVINEEYLLMGYNYSKENGLNQALFKVRVLRNIFSANNEQAYNFFLGAVLSGEVDAVLKMEPKKIVIGGKKQLRNALTALLSKLSNAEIICLSDEAVDNSSALGMIKIAEY